MDMDGNRFGIHPQAGDAGFLGGLAQRRRDDVVVGVVTVATGLHPAAQSSVQGEQHPAAAVVEHQRGRGHVPGHALTRTCVGAGEHEGQHRVSQRILSRVRRLPVGQDFDHRLSNWWRIAHLRTNKSSTAAGERGAAGSWA